MIIPLADSMFIMPICYHPTTVIHVDDDPMFLKFLSMELEKKLPIIGFEQPKEALNYAKNKHNFLPFTSRCLEKKTDGAVFNINKIRNEPCNPDRFKQIFITITDYDMPDISGLEFIKNLEFDSEISQFSHIILTGKASDEFKSKVSGREDAYIRKDDKDYLKKILAFVKECSSKIFQWYSYMPARILSQDTLEDSFFLFDGNFAPIFNSYIDDKNVCEFYLFDRQGSYMFLDEDANISWLFIRTQKGIKNTINLAKEFNAPKNVIDALESKKYILSLYEKSDFLQRKSINWDDYLLPAQIFESDRKFLGSFPNLVEENFVPTYYYAHTMNFPEHSVDLNNIQSYRQFLKNQE